MRVLTASEMRQVDQWAIRKLGIPGMVLMENAGRGVVEAIREGLSSGRSPTSRRGILVNLRSTDSGTRRWIRGTFSNLRVAILCGKGNNGGDGLVVARHLLNHGLSPRVYLAAKREEVRGNARTNLQIVQRLGIPFMEVVSPRHLGVVRRGLKEADPVIDALFGTGFKGSVGGIPAQLIELVNSLDLPVLAIDVPSGMDCDDGSIAGSCVRATLTVTLAFPKRGHFLYPGAGYTGTLRLADIGVPPNPPGLNRVAISLLTRETVRGLLPGRPPNGHKGTFGHILLISGSVGFTGASVLASLSALRSGAGLVTLGLPTSLNEAMEAKLTEVMTVPLPETPERTLAEQAIPRIQGLCEKATILALGPGLSTHPETSRLVRQVLSSVRIPTIVDADGLNALVGHNDVLRKAKAPIVISPHPGEMSRLLGIPTPQINARRIEVAQKAAATLRVAVALKGAPTIVAHPSGEAWINTTGSSAIATAGSGDVLTGLIAGMMGQGLSPYDAARAGVYVHGLAGDLAAQEKTPYGVIAGDILDRIPDALCAVLESDPREPQTS